MTYASKYTSLDKLTGELQMSFTNNSAPTDNQANSFIEEIETDIDSKFLGNATATNQMVDVPFTREDTAPPIGTITWFEYISDSRIMKYLTGGLQVNLPFIPVISVSKVERRMSPLGTAENWDQVTEGLGNNSTDAFLLMKRKYKIGYLGFAMYFYTKFPYTGIQRLRVTYNYGFNIPSVMLGTYATLRTCQRILFALAGTSNPAGMRQFAGGNLDTWVPTQYKDKWDELRIRVSEWEKQWLDRPIAVGII